MKLFSFILVLMLVLSILSGCNSSSNNEPELTLVTYQSASPSPLSTISPMANAAPAPTIKPLPASTAKPTPAPLTVKSRCTPTPFVNEINGSANIAKGGFAAIQDGWIYYSYSCNDDEKNGLYKMKVNGTKKVKLSGGYIDRINTTGDWLYYYSNNEGVYGIKTDGTEKDIWNEYDYNCAFDEVNVVNNQVYVSGYSDEWSLCKMDIHKNKMQVLLNDTHSDPNNLHIVNGWIYFYIDEPYLNVAKGQDVYKMRTNGTKKQLALEGNTYDFTVAGDWIYYLAVTNKGAYDEIYNLYKIKIDGTGRQKIVNGISVFDGKINVVSDWIFYLSIENDEVILNRIKTDGKDKEIIEYDNSTPVPGDSQDD